MGWRKREIFLQAGLDRANQLEPLQQIRFLAQRLFADFTRQGSENFFVRGPNRAITDLPVRLLLQASAHPHGSPTGCLHRRYVAERQEFRQQCPVLAVRKQRSMFAMTRSYSGVHRSGMISATGLSVCRRSPHTGSAKKRGARTSPFRTPTTAAASMARPAMQVHPGKRGKLIPAKSGFFCVLCQLWVPMAPGVSMSCVSKMRPYFGNRVVAGHYVVPMHIGHWVKSGHDQAAITSENVYRTKFMCMAGDESALPYGTGF